MTLDSSVEFLFSLSCIILFGKIFDFLHKRYGITVSLFVVALVFASVYPLTFLQWLLSPEALSFSVSSIGIGYIIEWFKGSPAPVLILSAFYCGLLLFSNNKNLESNLFVSGFAVTSFLIYLNLSPHLSFIPLLVLMVIFLSVHFAPSFTGTQKNIGSMFINLRRQLIESKLNQSLHAQGSNNFFTYKSLSLVSTLITLISLLAVVNKFRWENSLYFQMYWPRWIRNIWPD